MRGRRSGVSSPEVLVTYRISGDSVSKSAKAETFGEILEGDVVELFDLLHDEFLLIDLDD